MSTNERILGRYRVVGPVVHGERKYYGVVCAESPEEAIGVMAASMNGLTAMDAMRQGWYAEFAPDYEDVTIPTAGGKSDGKADFGGLWGALIAGGDGVLSGEEHDDDDYGGGE